MDPRWFNERLGSDAESLFRAACKSLRIDAKLEITGVPQGFLVFVNGRKVDPSEVTLISGRHLIQVMENGQRRFGAVVTVEPGGVQRVDTMLLAPEETRVPLAIPVSVGGAAVATGLLGWAALDRWGEYQEQYDACAEKVGGCDDVDAVHKMRRQAIGYGVGAGVALAVGGGFGVVWAVRW